MAFHFASRIGLFALASSDNEMDAVMCIKKLRTTYRAFLNAMRWSHSNPFLQKVVNASPFNTVVMEDLADVVVAPGIQTSDFIIKKFGAYALALFSSWGQTKVVEDNFQRMRQREGFDTTNKSHAPSAYWAMARDMGAIELHRRDHISPPEEPDIAVTYEPVKNELFHTDKHIMSVEGTEAITGTTAWPTFSPQTAPFQYSTPEFLISMNAKCDSEVEPLAPGSAPPCQEHEQPGPWALSGRAYRGILFHPGEIVPHAESGEYYMVLGQSGHLMVMLWKVVPMSLVKNEYLAFAVGTGLNQYSEPHWVSPLELDDFYAVPTKVVSPLHLFLSNGRKVHRHSGVVLMQTHPVITLIEHAAMNCFWGMKLPQLKIFCKESELIPTTPDILGHLEVMITCAIPTVTPEELTEILEMRCQKKTDPLVEIDPSVIEAMFPPEDIKVIEDIGVH